MNNLTKLYTKIKDFADSHNMVNEFILAGSEDELSQREFNYRTMVMLPLEANLSRELNNPVYELDFGIIVIDRTMLDDSLGYISSTEENVFVIGQLQDFLLQDNIDASFDNVELTTSTGEDYNVTIAMTDFSVKLARQPYVRDIDNQ